MKEIVEFCEQIQYDLNKINEYFNSLTYEVRDNFLAECKQIDSLKNYVQNYQGSSSSSYNIRYEIQPSEETEFLKDLIKFCQSHFAEVEYSNVNANNQNQGQEQKSKINSTIKKIENNNSDITKVDFAFQKLTYDQIERLTAALKFNKYVEELDISFSNISDKAFGLIASVLECNRKIIKLNVAHNFITHNGVLLFAESLEVNKKENDGNHYPLADLNIAGNNLGPQGVLDLASSFQGNDKLKVLNVSSNKIGDNKLPEILVKLKNIINLKQLDMSRNDIGPKSVNLLAQFIRDNIKIEDIDLSYNQWYDSGENEIISAAKKAKFFKFCYSPRINYIHGIAENLSIPLEKIYSLNSNSEEIFRPGLAKQPEIIINVRRKKNLLTFHCSPTIALKYDKKPLDIEAAKISDVNDFIYDDDADLARAIEESMQETSFSKFASNQPNSNNIMQDSDSISSSQSSSSATFTAKLDKSKSHIVPGGPSF